MNLSEMFPTPPERDPVDSPSLDEMFDPSSYGAVHLANLLNNESVTEMTINNHQTIFYKCPEGKIKIREQLFPNAESYIVWINRHLLTLTDAAGVDIEKYVPHALEASFKAGIAGSVHVATSRVTQGEPAVTIRKQPQRFITLDQMVQHRMLNDWMRNDLEQYSRGRLNILISGTGGAGKTTMARALAQFIDPNDRVVTVEDIDELHLKDGILDDVYPMFTSRSLDEKGRVVAEVTLDDLIRDAFRVRTDRIWVGECRGREAHALVKAALSGHAGCVTTVHGESARDAIEQLILYVQESPDVSNSETARDLVSRGFDLVVHIDVPRPGMRFVGEVAAIEATHGSGGANYRINKLWEFDRQTGKWDQRGEPGPRLREKLMSRGASIDGPPPSAFGINPGPGFPGHSAK